MKHHASCARYGTILILVVGLAAILLSVTTAILVSLRSGSADAELAMRNVQARIMLSAAVAYIQESSRLGWGGESYGWNDVRAISGSRFAGTPVGEHGVPGPLKANEANLAVTGFPKPGSVARGDVFAWERPPGAVSERYAPNPIVFMPDLRPTDDPNCFIRKPSDYIKDDRMELSVALANNYAQLISGNFTEYVNGYDKVTVPANQTNRQGKVGGLDPQPLADTWDGFITGIRNPRPESLGRAWFRIYRETLADHDGDGQPWYDTIPLRGHGVFIVAAGAGATRGYRFWNASGRDYLNGDRSRSRPTGSDSEFAESSGLFLDEETFIAQRASERIIWFRLEWTSAVSGYDAWGEHPWLWGMPEDWKGSAPQVSQNFLHRTTLGSNPGYYPNFGGTIRWLMRLEKEPDQW